MYRKQCKVLLQYSCTDIPNSDILDKLGGNDIVISHARVIEEHADALFKLFNDYARRTPGISARNFIIKIERNKGIEND